MTRNVSNNLQTFVLIGSFEQENPSTYCDFASPVFLGKFSKTLFEQIIFIIQFDRITNEPIQETCPPAVSSAVASGGNNKNNVAVVTNGPATTATTAAASSSSTATTIAASITTTTAVTTNEVDEKDENKQATTTTEAPEELTKRENEMTKENALSFYAEK